jgi:peroxiredoxin
MEMAERMKEDVQAPGFELVDTQGRTISLANYRGQPVVLVLTRGFI